MMNDDQYLLASAYADGDVTPAERALAEADPAVMAEVDRLQALRGALRDVAPHAEGARTAMIAAAMREFHASAVSEAEPRRAVTPPRSRATRRIRWERPLGLAAAAIAVLAIGAGVVTGGRGGGDDSSDMADATTAAEAADASAVLVAPADQDATMEAPAADTIAAASTEFSTVLDEPTDGAGDEPVGATAGTARELDVIESPEELAAAGLELRASQAGDSTEGDDTVTTMTTTVECTFTAAVESPLAVPEAEPLRDQMPELADRVELLDLREYRVAPDDVRPALIAVDLETGQAFAIDADRCALLAVGPRP